MPLAMLGAVKIQYTIPIDDFRALQIPFTSRAETNAGFKGAIFVCSLMVALGVYCLLEGMGLPLGGFLVGLGAALAIILQSRSGGPGERVLAVELSAGLVVAVFFLPS
jgi:hypothetical protein